MDMYDEPSPDAMKRLRTESILAFAVFAISLLVYIRTLAPGVTFTDAGELAVDCISLGVAHPTGYPLFTMLGHLWVSLPLPGTPIYRLNLFAAVCTSLSAVMFYKAAVLLLRRLSRQDTSPQPPPSKGGGARETAPVPISDKVGTGKDGVVWAAFAAALSYAFARTIWQQATAIEVYSLHLLLLLSALYLFLKAVWAEEQRTRNYLVFALVYGLAFTNHLTIVYTFPALLFLFIKQNGFKKRTWVLLAKMAPVFIVGLLPILYLPLRSAGGFPFHGPPHFDWGGVGRSWEKFVYHATARGFSQRWQTDSWHERQELMARQFGVAKHVFFNEVAFVGVLPLLIGFLTTLRRSRWPFLVFLALLAATCFAVATNYNIFDIESYFALAFTAALLLMTAGLLPLARRGPGLACLALLIPAVALGVNFKENDRSKEVIVEEYTRNVVDNLAPNAMIISGEWDFFLSPLWYYQYVDHYRPDVVIIDSNLMQQTWYLDQLRRWYPDIMRRSAPEEKIYAANLENFESGKPYKDETMQATYVAFLNSLIDNNIQDRPVYFTQESGLAEQGIGAKYHAAPAGLAYRWVSDLKARPWNTDFKFTNLLAFDMDPDDVLQKRMYFAASTGVYDSARFQGMNGRQAYAMELMQLAQLIRSKVPRK
jgi:hypothetical protein